DTNPTKYVTVTASLKSDEKVYTITKNIEFTIAYPKEMLMMSEKEIFPATGLAEATLTIYTYRDLGAGRVSDGIRILLSSSTTNDNMEIIVQPFVETSKGRASFVVKSVN